MQLHYHPPSPATDPAWSIALTETIRHFHHHKFKLWRRDCLAFLLDYVARLTTELATAATAINRKPHNKTCKQIGLTVTHCPDPAAASPPAQLPIARAFVAALTDLIEPQWGRTPPSGDPLPGNIGIIIYSTVENDKPKTIITFAVCGADGVWHAFNETGNGRVIGGHTIAHWHRRSQT